MSKFYPIDGTYLKINRLDDPEGFDHDLSLSIDPAAQVDYFEDFFRYSASDWTITETDAAATEALDVTEYNGCLKISNTAADNDTVNMQALSTIDVTNKFALFEARFKVSDASQVDMFIGLSETNTAIISAGGGPPGGHHIGFWMNDGTPSLNLSIGNSTGVSAEIPALNGTVSNSTYVNVAFKVLSNVTNFYINGALVSTLTHSNFPTNKLRPSFALANGEAVAKTMTIDYIGARSLRL